jgi:hypothetical protein
MPSCVHGTKSFNDRDVIKKQLLKRMSKGCARVSSREKIYWKSLVREDE